MRILLDTHAFLWFVWKDAKLSATALAHIVDPNNQLFLSPANYWEVAIKVSIKKLTLSEPYSVFFKREIAQHQITILDITVDHTDVVTTLPFHHKDPFDRLIIAQAMVEDIPVVSDDNRFDKYPITRFW